MNLANKRRVALMIAFLVGLNGVGNIAVGACSFFVVESLNITGRVSALNSLIDSLDPSLVDVPILGDQISSLKTAVIEDLNVFLVHSQNLNIIPAYLIFQGIIFVAISLAVYFVIPREEKSPNI